VEVEEAVEAAEVVVVAANKPGIIEAYNLA
jgi:hypothetical protein